MKILGTDLEIFVVRELIEQCEKEDISVIGRITVDRKTQIMETTVRIL
jgi:hypothetical protein